MGAARSHSCQPFAHLDISRTCVQSPYYYVGHISRYAPPGTIRVECEGEGFARSPQEHDAVKDYIKPQTKGDPPPSGTVDLVAGCFVTADGASGVVVVMNPNADAAGKDFVLSLTGTGAVSAHLPAHSVRTFTFKL